MSFTSLHRFAYESHHGDTHNRQVRTSACDDEVAFGLDDIMIDDDVLDDDDDDVFMDTTEPDHMQDHIDGLGT